MLYNEEELLLLASITGYRQEEVVEPHNMIVGLTFQVYNKEQNV